MPVRDRSTSLKKGHRPNTSMANSRTQSRLKHATQTDYMVNNDSYGELKNEEKAMHRPNSLSNIREHVTSAEKQYDSFEIVKNGKNLHSRTRNDENQAELFDKYCKTIKTTDKTVFNKILNFTNKLDSDDNYRVNAMTTPSE